MFKKFIIVKETFSIFRMSSNAAATAVAERKLDQSVQTVFSRTKDLKMGK